MECVRLRGDEERGAGVSLIEISDDGDTVRDSGVGVGIEDHRKGEVRCAICTDAGRVSADLLAQWFNIRIFNPFRLVRDPFVVERVSNRDKSVQDHDADVEDRTLDTVLTWPSKYSVTMQGPWLPVLGYRRK